MKELPERGFNYSNSEGSRALSSLSSDKENELVSQINSYQQTLERCFDKREIHSLCFYLGLSGYLSFVLQLSPNLG